MIFDRQTVAEWLEVFAGSLVFMALLAGCYLAVAVVSILMGN